MILVDANLLLYAYDRSSPHHFAAREWLEKALSEPQQIGLPWMTILAFVRISTSSRVLEHPLSPAEAMAIVARWLERSLVTIPNPTERHWEILRGLVTKGQARGPLVMDAHLAALALEHGATLATVDRDFARFPGLKVLNPFDQ